MEFNRITKDTMKVNIVMDKSTEKENLFGMMVLHMKACFKKDLFKVKELLKIPPLNISTTANTTKI
jgi:hypothetical protein